MRLTTGYAVTIRIGAEDFAMLVEDGGPLASIPPDKRGRFADAPTREWQRIYWLGSQYTTVLLARSFLEAIGEAYQIVYDEAQWDDGRVLGWAILTDYEEAK